MYGIFRDLVGFAVYLDDMAVYMKTFEGHLKTLEEVFRRLRENGLFLKPKKCAFVMKEVKLLGHIINEKGIHTDPDKVKAVTKFKTPTSKTEIQAFLGLSGYYRRFIQD